MKSVTTFIAFFIAMSNLLSIPISGEIKDENDVLVEVGNVLLLSKTDQSLLKGEIFYDGVLSFEFDLKETAILKITALGFEDYEMEINPAEGQDKIDLGTIVLKTVSLDAVVVRARKQMFVQDADKITVNVENSMLSNSGNALDVLGRSPRLSVSEEGSVTMFGRGDALIYLDGQLIASNDILEGISSEDIREIQVLKNPSAQYDAQGKAVILIFTKKKKREGWQLDFQERVTFASKLRSNTRVGGFINAGKLSLQASYNLPYGRSIKNKTAITSYDIQNDVFDYKRTSEPDIEWLYHSFNVSSKYRLNNSSSLGFSYRGFLNNADRKITSSNEVFINNALQSTINTGVIGDDAKTNHQVALNYNVILDTLSSLFIGGQASIYDIDNQSDITISANDTDPSTKRSGSTAKYNLYSAQMDYRRTAKNNKNLNFDLGVKNSYFDNSNSNSFFNDNNVLIDSTFSNKYTYTENIAAAYVNMSYRTGKWSMNAGLRGEHTSTQSESQFFPEQNIDNNYFRVFPSVSISKDIKDDLTMSLSYNYKITRPSIGATNPDLSYIDTFTIIQGNPGLKPSFDHVLATYLYYKRNVLEIGATYSDGGIHSIIFQDPNNLGVFSTSPQNIDYGRSIYANLSIPQQVTNWWFASVESGVILEEYRYKTSEIDINKGKPFFYVDFYNQFTIPKIFVGLDASLSYGTPYVYGLTRRGNYLRLSFGIKKSFLDNTLTLQLSGNDLLNRDLTISDIEINNYSQSQRGTTDSRQVIFSVFWKIGDMKARGVRNRGIGREELQRLN